MARPIAGIHHVTAIATDPKTNKDFYTEALGLRLVKKTVNFDDPGTYHLYFGDEQGTPGTILTFFPWPLARRGSRGSGQATVTSFSVAEGSLGWWAERLGNLGVIHEDPASRFGGDEEVLTFLDPDGLKLELVAHPGSDDRRPWAGGPVPAEHGIRGFYAVTLTERDLDVTTDHLTETLGFRAVGEEGDRLRFDTGEGGPGARVDLLGTTEPRGRIAAGTVHHVALRVADEDEQVAWRESLAGRGFHITPVLDRQYFHSVYFREPGGVLFELATDPPGFTLDETVDELGSALKLPPWLESRRDDIAAALPSLDDEEGAEA